MRTLFIIIAIVTRVFVQAQNQAFYYHNGEKIYLDKMEDTKINVLYKKGGVQSNPIMYLSYHHW